MTIFEKDGDYAAFEDALSEAHEHVPMRMVTYCLMPNHWHFVLWPLKDGDLSTFMHWLTLTHVQRWHAYHNTAGLGHLYQGRFKSFPVESDDHFFTVCRYVERNALRASLADRAEHWRWGSLHRRLSNDPEATKLLADGPLPFPQDWVDEVNRPQTQPELDAIRRCLRRGCPYGTETWVERIAASLGLTSTLRQRGRPRKRG